MMGGWVGGLRWSGHKFGEGGVCDGGLQWGIDAVVDVVLGGRSQ